MHACSSVIPHLLGAMAKKRKSKAQKEDNAKEKRGRDRGTKKAARSVIDNAEAADGEAQEAFATAAGATVAVEQADAVCDTARAVLLNPKP